MELETWTINKNRELGERIIVCLNLSGLTNESQSDKISTKSQRELMGCAIFGNKKIHITQDNKIAVTAKVSFGQDSQTYYYNIDHVVSNISNSVKL